MVLREAKRKHGKPRFSDKENAVFANLGHGKDKSDVNTETDPQAKPTWQTNG
jgi:hypothetical protein